MSADELRELHRLLTRRTGIELERGGLRAALDRYVLARSNELGLPRVSDYVRLLDEPQGPEFERLVAIITVPHTWFFRDPAQIEAIGQTLTERARRVGRPLRIWVPACATGEDPYSLSLLVEHLGLNARIVASDICRPSLARAESARYTHFSLRDLPAELFVHFRREGDTWIVAPSIRGRVQFEQHNLVEPPLRAGDGWDLVLCRNVLIYFSAETGSACAERIAHSLHDEGVVFFGAGELIQNCPRALSPLSVGPRIAFRRSSRAPSSPGHTPAGERSPARAALEPRAAPARVALEPRGAPAALEPQRAPSFDPRDAPATLEHQDARAHEPQRARDREATRAPSLEARAVQAPLAEPRPDAASLEDAHALFESEDFESAALAYLSAAARDPTNAELRMYSGIALYLCSDFARAENELRAALLLDEGLWPAAVYSGLCLDSLGVPHQADTEYRHAVRLLEGTTRSPVAVPPILRGFQDDLLDLARRRAERHQRPHG